MSFSGFTYQGGTAPGAYAPAIVSPSTVVANDGTTATSITPAALNLSGVRATSAQCQSQKPRRGDRDGPARRCHIHYLYVGTVQLIRDAGRTAADSLRRCSRVHPVCNLRSRTLWQVDSIVPRPRCSPVPQKFSVASLFLTAINSPSLTVTLTAYNGAAVVGSQVVSLTTGGGHQQVRSACGACICVAAVC